MDNYVQKEAGKVLSSNDFTGELKLKLESLSNYDDSEVKGRLADLENAADTHLCEIPNSMYISETPSSYFETFEEALEFGKKLAECRIIALEHEQKDFLTSYSKSGYNANDTSGTRHIDVVAYFHYNISTDLKVEFNLTNGDTTQEYTYSKEFIPTIINDLVTNKSDVSLSSSSRKNTNG